MQSSQDGVGVGEVEFFVAMFWFFQAFRGRPYSVGLW